MKKDIVVIGGGLGGLTYAAIAASKGYSVTLLEQYARVGGYATTWHRSGVHIEGALHEIDDLSKDSFKAQILKELGIYDKLEIVYASKNYRVITNSGDYSVPHSKDGFEKMLIELFPEEKESIKKYFKTITDIKNEVYEVSSLKGFAKLKLLLFPILYKNLAKYDKASVAELMNELFSSEELKLLVLHKLGYYSDNPNSLGAIFFSIAECSYSEGGGWFIKGGSQKLSNALKDVIEAHGGEVITNAEVITILTKDNRASGVKYRKKDKFQTLEADMVINNASPLWAVDALENKSSLDKETFELYKNAKIGPSSFGVYMVVDGAKAPEGRAYSTFVYSEAKSMDNLSSSSYSEFESRDMEIADYGAIDSGLSDKNRRLVSLFVTDRYEEWCELSEVAYKEKKERCAQILLKRVEKLYPDIIDSLISYEAATPMTMERYTKATKGAIYGFSQTPLQSGRHREKFSRLLPNLINISGWGEIGGGFSAVIQDAVNKASLLKSNN
ncbi:MAG: phytoene desaturase family protein [Campylobacterales bacterium]